MFESLLSVRVYYSDTDALGVVYHANYLRFLEMARTESLRERGIELPFLLTHYGIQFAVVTATVKFKKPARLGDQLCIATHIIKLGKASLTYAQNIYLTNRGGDLVCTAEIKLVTVDSKMHLLSIPKALKMEISDGC